VKSHQITGITEETVKKILTRAIILAVVIALLTGCGRQPPSAPPDNTRTVTMTITISQTPEDTVTASPTFSVTETSTPTFTATATPTNTPFYELFRRGVYPDASYAGAADAELWDYTKDTNYGGCDAMGAGALPLAGLAIIRSLLKYDVSSINPGVYVVKSQLTVQKGYCIGTVDPYFYLLNVDFVEGDGCNTLIAGASSWNSTGTVPWTTPGGDGDYQTTPASAPIFIDCTRQMFTFVLDNSAVESWINTPAGNHGMILVATDEATAGNAFRVMSSESINPPDYRPLLEIYYYRP
jgi:hypothetical protein